MAAGGINIKRIWVNLIIGTVLTITSIIFYILQIIIFKAPMDTAINFFQNIAFLPVQVIIVTLVLDQILVSREKREKIKKVNMVISGFFSDVGIETISIVSNFELNFNEVRQKLDIKGNWTDSEFKNAIRNIKELNFKVDSRSGDLNLLKNCLLDKKDYMLRMFQNPTLLEHDTFTDMLWAVFHVCDELGSRTRLEGLPDSDLDHLSNDIKRALELLIIEWILYMNHLRKEYPYLFSLAVRKNPFGNHNSVIVLQ